MPTASPDPLAKPLSTRTLFDPPALDVESVAEETSARETNRMLRSGWRLLQVVHAHDGAGGYPVYVVGKVRDQAFPSPAHTGEERTS